MDDDKTAIARSCLQGAEDDTMTFPDVVSTLTAAGFDSYFVDFRLQRATYYLPDGQSVDLDTRGNTSLIPETFDVDGVRAAIGEAQRLASGYSYRGFCEKVKRAGCAGYLVSILGRRVMYFGRTAESHIEHFPQ